VRYAPLNAEIQRVLAQLPDASAVAQVETLLTDAGTIVTLRCAFPPETPLSEVHNAMARLERDLRRLVPVRRNADVDRALKGQPQRLFAHAATDQHRVVHLEHVRIGQPEHAMD